MASQNIIGCVADLAGVEADIFIQTLGDIVGFDLLSLGITLFFTHS